jgi:hypothetical protein
MVDFRHDATSFFFYYLMNIGSLMMFTSFGFFLVCATPMVELAQLFSGCAKGGTLGLALVMLAHPAMLAHPCGQCTLCTAPSKGFLMFPGPSKTPLRRYSVSTYPQ